MKKIFVFLFLISTISIYSQKLILDEKYEKNNFPVGFNFLNKSNKIIIKKGYNHFGSTSDNINNIYSYDSEGNKTTILENINLMFCVFSETENTFQASEYVQLRGNYQYNFFLNNNVSALYLRKSFNSFSNEQILGSNFNDKYLIYLSNEKGKGKLNLLKNEVYVEIFGIFSNEHKRVKINNINTERLLGPNNIKYSEELGFSVKIIDNNFFEIITKSISKDYKSTTLYRSIFDFEGNLIKDTSYQVNIKEDYLIYSNSGSTYKFSSGRDSEFLNFGNDLAINNFEVDRDGNVYIYGLTGEKQKELNDYNETSGFYIFKFDKEGNKIWEYSKNSIDDPKLLNKKFPLSRLDTSLSVNGNKIVFLVGTDYVNEFFHYAVVNKNDGSLIKNDKVVFNEKKRTVTNYAYSFIPEFYKLPSNKKIFTNRNGLIVADYDLSIQNFIKTLNVNDNINFNVVFSEEGTWLIESDNNSYYKIYYFKSV